MKKISNGKNGKFIRRIITRVVIRFPDTLKSKLNTSTLLLLKYLYIIPRYTVEKLIIFRFLQYRAIIFAFHGIIYRLAIAIAGVRKIETVWKSTHYRNIFFRIDNKRSITRYYVYESDLFSIVIVVGTRRNILT